MFVMLVWILGGKQLLIYDVIYVLKLDIVEVNIEDYRKFKNMYFMEFFNKVN